MKVIKGEIFIGLATIGTLLTLAWRFGGWTERVELRLANVEKKMGIAQSANIGGRPGLFIPFAEAKDN